MIKRYLALLLLILPVFLEAQTRVTVRGKVTASKDYETLIGVTVKEKGTKNGTATDINGQYTLSVGSNSVLVFSYAGYIAKEVTVNENHTINVSLAEDQKMLDDVVVIGYGVAKRSDLTSSISTVKGEDLKNTTAGNAMLSLQGKANGVQVTASGAPGASPRVLIRGVTTINGTDPLYVVDGSPVGTNINFLNQDDIESIEILKDASASAIYGTRGANGIIIITTKKGTQGKNRFQLNSSVGLQTITKPKLADAATYALVFKERYTNDESTPLWNEKSDKGINTDWWDQTVNDFGYTQTHNLSFQGGNDKLIYSGSLGYFQQQSQFDVGQWKRITGRFNTEYTFSKTVKAGINLAPKYENWNDTPDLFSSVMRMDPTTPVFNAQEDWVANPFNNYARSYNNQTWNPVASVARENRHSNEYGMLMIPFISIEPVKGLVARTQYSVNARFRLSDEFSPVFYIDNLEKNDRTKIQRTARNWVDWNWINTLNYNTTIATMHHFNMMGAFTMEKEGDYQLFGSRDGVPSNHPDLQYLNAGTLTPQSSGTNIYRTLISYLGRIMYNYDNRYYLTGTYRIDGSSRFPSGNKYAKSPSVSVAWRASEEAFLKDVEAISNLKIRAGWGRVGNQNIDPDLYLNLIGASDYVFGPGGERQIGTSISQVGNTQLGWETVEDYNMGLDVSLLKGKLDITADFFSKKSKGMLMPKPNLSILGYPMWAGEMMTNIGTMQARGWELSFRWKDKTGDFGYEAGINLSNVKNKALKFVDNTPLLRGGFFNDFITRNEEGGEISRFYGYVADGIFQNQTEINSHTGEHGEILQQYAVPGDIRFKDLNRDGVLNEKDKTYIGKAFPDLTAGLNIRLSYKNVDLVSNFYGTFGNDIYNSAMAGFYSGADGQNVYADAYDKAWRGEGTSNFYPRLSDKDSNLNFKRVSSFFVEDGSYFRCNLLQLGYTLPKKITKGMGVRLSASGQNLFTITGYSGMDPERAGLGGVLEAGIDNIAYPNPRTFLFGVNVNF